MKSSNGLWRAAYLWGVGAVVSTCMLGRSSSSMKSSNGLWRAAYTKSRFSVVSANRLER